MGEIIEIKTYPCEERQFYPVYGGGIRLEVKTKGKACIAVTPHVNNHHPTFYPIKLPVDRQSMAYRNYNNDFYYNGGNYDEDSDDDNDVSYEYSSEDGSESVEDDNGSVADDNIIGEINNPIGQDDNYMAEVNYQLAEPDNDIVEENNQIAEENNQIAEEVIQIAEDGIQIAEDVNQIAEDGIQIAEDVNQLVENNIQIAENDVQILQDENNIAENDDTVNHGRSKFLPIIKMVEFSEDHFTELWISWFGPYIEVGEGDNPSPFHRIRKHGTARINFITFYSDKSCEMATWRFELRPQNQKFQSTLPQIYSMRPRWVKQSDPLPHDAIIGGHENKEPLYIMRAPQGGSLTPGKYVPSKKRGYLGWTWLEHEKTKFEILCGYNIRWVKCFRGETPSGAVHAGISEGPSDGKCLYVGRAFHKGHLIVGKVQPTHGCCYIPFQGHELRKDEYEVLISPIEGAEYIHQRL